MTSENQVCIIIGASHAGAQLATSLRKEGWAGKILVGLVPMASNISLQADRER